MDSAAATPATVRRGRPNKYIELESGEFIKKVHIEPPRDEDAPQEEETPKKRRGRPPKRSTKGPPPPEGPPCNVEGPPSSSSNIVSSRTHAGPRRSVTKNKKYSADFVTEDVPSCSEFVLVEEDSRGEGTSQEHENGREIRPTKPTKGRRGKRKEVEEDSAEVVSPASELPDVRCGACSADMPRNRFAHHKSSVHNGLAWREGEDPPIDYRDTSIANQNLLTNLISEAFGKKLGTRAKGGYRKAGKGLRCEKCEMTCMSAAGYLSHFRFCGVSDEEREARMWTCPLCERVLLPASRYYHEQQHVQREALEALASRRAIDVAQQPPNPEVRDEAGRPQRRRAAVKAQTFLQEHLGTLAPSSSSSSSSSKPAVPTYHLASQESSGAQLQCSACSVQCATEAEILQHLAEVHPQHAEEVSGGSDYSGDEASSGSEVAEETEDSKKPRSSVCPVPRSEPRSSLSSGFLLRCMTPHFALRHRLPYPPCVRWALARHVAAGRGGQLFPELVRFQLQDTQPLSHAPATRRSLPFCVSSSMTHPTLDSSFAAAAHWISLEAYRGCVEGGCPTLFCGGPVSSLAWCPGPPSEQLLAVSCLPEMDCALPLGMPLSQAGVLQLWNLGSLLNSTSLASREAPQLVMGLTHEWGVVRQLAWCPSGCWDSNQGLYGLLAAACSDGTVRLLPVHKYDGTERAMQAKVSRTLAAHQLARCPCLRVCWYSGPGHAVLAGGFADGLVCLWRPGGLGQLLETEEGQTLLPYLRFQAHPGPVTALQLVPWGPAEPRYLFTGCNTDKNTTYWDLERQGEVCLGLSSRRNRVVGASWLSSWPSAACAYEDLQAGSCLVAPRGLAKNHMVLAHNSAALCMDKSDWLNGLAHGTSAGEISLALFSQLIFGMDLDKGSIERRALLTRTGVAQLLPPAPSEQAATYAGCAGQGLVFCDVRLDCDRPWPQASRSARCSDTMDLGSSASYPLSAVSQLAWNPNPRSCGWIAAGYQCGLVRLLHVACASTDRTIASALAAAKQH